jgi:hypothetical protein
VTTLSASLSSRKTRRWFGFASALVLVAGIVAALIVFFGNTGKEINAPVTNKPAQVPNKEKPIALDPQARTVAARFIETAVARKNLAASWNLVGPELKSGFTKAQWLSGDIPVIPFTAKIGQVRLKTDLSEPRHALLEVLLLPTAAKVKPAFFFLELKKPAQRWQVVAWTPRSNIAVPAQN